MKAGKACCGGEEEFSWCFGQCAKFCPALSLVRASSLALATPAQGPRFSMVTATHHASSIVTPQGETAYDGAAVTMVQYICEHRLSNTRVERSLLCTSGGHLPVSSALDIPSYRGYIGSSKEADRSQEHLQRHAKITQSESRFPEIPHPARQPGGLGMLPSGAAPGVGIAESFLSLCSACWKIAMVCSHTFGPISMARYLLRTASSPAGLPSQSSR